MVFQPTQGKVAMSAQTSSLSSLPTSTSSSPSFSSALLPSLPPPLSTGIGLGASAVLASTLFQPGHSGTVTNLASAALFASSFKNLVFPTGTTPKQQQDSMTMGALGIAAVAAINAIASSPRDSRQEAEAAAARARDEARKAHEEALAARRAAEQQAFLWGKSQSQPSQTETQLAQQLRELYAAQRNKA